MYTYIALLLHIVLKSFEKLCFISKQCVFAIYKLSKVNAGILGTINPDPDGTFVNGWDIMVNLQQKYL